jgi:hypothetical protein
VGVPGFYGRLDGSRGSLTVPLFDLVLIQGGSRGEVLKGGRLSGNANSVHSIVSRG